MTYRTLRYVSRLSSTFTSTRPFSSVSPSPRPKHTYFRILALISLVGIGAYTAGAVAPHPIFVFVAPRPAPAPPADPESPESLAYVASLEEKLQSLPLLASLRSQPDADKWYEARPYKRFPEERRVNNLTAGALRGPGRLALIPLVRAKSDETEAISFVHVGHGLCGHDGIIHGGLLATLLDENLARTFIVLKAHLVEKSGRRVRVAGQVEDLNGNVLVEATGTFVQPKYASMLSNSVVKQAMGEPEPKNAPVLLSEGVPPPARKP
ncbi:hypothetical protein ID866_3969 [Astraeus odoratus]|nr:hypothetical protein ID866_3969 [Astraeus odoratus]